MDALSPTGFSTGAKPQQTAPVPAAPVVKSMTERDGDAPDAGPRAEAAKKVAAEVEAVDAVLPERHASSLQFVVDGDRVVTTIVDDQNNEVVVPIPDAELIRIAKSIDRMQGFFIEQKA